MRNNINRWIRCILMCLCGLHGLLLAQTEPPPVNDRCAGAQPIQVGTYLSGLSNRHATLGTHSTPAPYPTTCITSYENDLWFSFTTTEAFRFYRIVISVNECNTPAGLQSLLIRTDDCDPKNFLYKGCANTESLDTIKFHLDEANAGTKYLLYVDGFDGTVCDFNILLYGLEESQFTREDLKFFKYDYEVKTEPPYVPGNLTPEFANNYFSMSWTAPPELDLAYFMVERVYPYPKKNPHTELMAVIDPKNNVGGTVSRYEFSDYKTQFRAAQEYCYRVVRVSSAGEKFFSENVCMDATIIEDFYVHFVHPAAGQPGFYEVKYINHKHKTDFALAVLDANKSVLKSMALRKEPARDGTITLDMSPYGPGTYYFKMGTGKDAFLRKFEVLPR